MFDSSLAISSQKQRTGSIRVDIIEVFSTKLLTW